MAVIAGVSSWLSLSTEGEGAGCVVEGGRTGREDLVLSTGTVDGVASAVMGLLVVFGSVDRRGYRLGPRGASFGSVVSWLGEEMFGRGGGWGGGVTDGGVRGT